MRRPPRPWPLDARVRLGALALLLAGCPPRGAGVRESGGPPRPSDARTLPLFDPAGLGAADAPPRRSDLPVEAIEVGPVGASDGPSALHVRFNQPLVALGDPPAPAPGLFTLDPPFAGEARWEAPDLLVYRFAEPLPPAHRVAVRVGRELLGPGRPALQRALEWTFETPRPTVVVADPDPEGESFLSEGDEDRWGGSWKYHRRTRPFFLEFSAPIAVDEARAHLKASARPWVKGGGPAIDVPITIRRPTAAELDEHLDEDAADRSVVVEPRGRWPIGSRITVTVAPGLKGAKGPLAVDTPWSTAFETHPPLALEGGTCGPTAPCGLEPITLRLTNPILADELKKITVSPRPRALEITLMDDWDEDGGREVIVDGQFLPDTEYTVTIPATLRDHYGQGIAGGAVHRAKIVARPTLALSSASGVLSPGQAQTIGVESRHVAEVAVKLGVYSDAELAGVDLASDALAALPFPAKTIERTIALDPAGKTEWSSRALDLAALAGGSGRLVLVEARATRVSARGRPHGVPEAVRGLYRLTDLGPVATLSRSTSHVQVVRLSTAEPVPKARVYRADAKARGGLLLLGETDGDGLYTLPQAEVERRLFPARRDPGGPLRLVIADPTGADRALLDLREIQASDPAPGLRPGERLLAKVVTERGVYRPGERIRVLGWSAIETPFSRTNLRRVDAGAEVVFELVDREGRTIAREAARTRADGRFWAPLEIPAEAALGRHVVQITMGYRAAQTAIEVEDYRVPEFTVDARPRRPELLAGESATIDVRARYYFGGAAPIQRLTRSVECRAASYRPPGLEDLWVVGDRRPRSARPWSVGERTREPLGADAASGRHALVIGPERALLEGPERCGVAIAVQDRSNQETGAEARFLVHPAAYYLAMIPPRRAVEVGETAEVSLRAVDPEGRRVAARITLEITRRWQTPRWREEGREKVLDGWEEKEAALPPCVVEARATGDDARCALKIADEGTYVLVATSEERGTSRSATTASGFRARAATKATTRLPASAAPESLEVVAEPLAARPGDAVEIAVRGPYTRAHGVLVLAREGVREVHPIRLEDGEARVRLVTDDSWTPAVTAEATVIAPTPAEQVAAQVVRPRVDRARVRIEQGHAHRRLRVHVDAPAQASPRATITIGVKVRDADDRPTPARVALWAVDEAVLDLTDHTTPDLLPEFIPSPSPAIHGRDDFRALLRPYRVAAGDPWFDEGQRIHLGNTGLIGKGGGGGTGHGRGGEPTARERFETTPIYLADLAVGPSGEAKVEAALPDNLTTFRITAIASAPLADGSATGRFGQVDARTVVSAPLAVRGALPRHLRPGDRAEVAALVDDLAGRGGRVEVEAEVVQETGSKGPVLKILSKKTAIAEVEPGGQARVAFEVEALAVGAPTIELRATLKPADGSTPGVDAVRQPLPIAAERTLRERVAVYGSLADDVPAAIPIQLPKGALPSHGGVEVALTSTLLGDLDEAVRALVEYPHGCAEQTASRLLPLVALGELRRAVDLRVDDPSAAIRAGVDRLLAMQRSSGGFAYWPDDAAVNLYVSAYATWVLDLARAAGHPVADERLRSAHDFLRQRAAAASALVREGRGITAGVEAAIAVHVLADAGDSVQELARALFEARQRLPIFARAFVLMALHRGDPRAPEVATLTREILGSIDELPGTAHTREPVDPRLDAYFTSDGRSDAIVLLALLRIDADHPRVEKLARGLLGRRPGGAWRNTQENAYALVALAEYARRREPTPPDLDARAWVGDDNVLDVHLRGRDGPPQVARVDMPELLRASRRGSIALPVTLERRGEGRVYYRLAAEWAPAERDLPARAQGLAITRRLRGASGPLVGPATAGEPLALDVTVKSDARVRYVAIDVPLPAGLEAVSRALGEGRNAAVLAGRRGGWVAHEEQRADRVILYVDDLGPGAHVHTIDLRATARGRFQFPPAEAEAMYMPEVYGRSEGGGLVVR